MEWLLVPIVLVLGLALVVPLRRFMRGRARTGRDGFERDPKQRQKHEEEIRRRHGGSGPTVDGGQHLR